MDSNPGLEASDFLEGTVSEAFDDIKPILTHRDVESRIDEDSAKLTISSDDARPLYWSYTLWVADDHLYYEISHADGPGGWYKESEQLGSETFDHVEKQEIVSHILLKYRHFGLKPTNTEPSKSGSAPSAD